MEKKVIKLYQNIKEFQVCVFKQSKKDNVWLYLV